MTMTKNDYAIIATVVNSIRGSNTECDQIADSLTWRFIGALEAENPRFNRHTFKKECGYDDADNWVEVKKVRRKLQK
jgi:hypothetical protein